VAPAATCTDAVVGAKPDFITVMSTVPGTETMVVVPAASVRWDVPATTTSAVFDGLFSGTDLNANRRRLTLSADRGGRVAGKNSHHQHERAHTHPPPVLRTHQSIPFLNR
jgi:hypothetical protein